MWEQDLRESYGAMKQRSKRMIQKGSEGGRQGGMEGAGEGGKGRGGVTEGERGEGGRETEAGSLL